MAPLVPRMHLFEIDDQTWFPAFLRAKVQAALTVAWTTHVPMLQTSSPAQLVARVLSSSLGQTIRDYVFIDFCAGGGGPTPSIETHLNRTLTSSLSDKEEEPVLFVLTDLHPHTESWRAAAALSPNLTYIPESVDAANCPPDLISSYKTPSSSEKPKRKIFRLFNLAFHHFDDPLAKAILRNTVNTSDAFGIFELQQRNFLGFITCCLFGIGIFLCAPYYAFKWRSPATLLFTYLIPVLPFVLVFDGWMSALRTRTPDEVEALLRTCTDTEGGSGEEIAASWEVRSGRETFMWPVGELNWIICAKKER
ncbi:hypothetical protein B0H66DRAFT_295354 [Apodospora peruviana]|uniref:Uncharacterized protein n=1 Tax=Apodospora peruviana TaxID=516989 RepID=A0AAE0I0T9_9PEZI|nr:hypothetical protein B0H66DRAFT_295354 [Apodospora peruviana]